ncbi:MAG: UvrD-helicase domain-containing protein [Pseudomonadota bacterium]
MPSNLLQGLNPEQLEAVTLPRESALVLAGAGSGKTRVLTTRIAYLIQTGQISPGGILAVTFTNKAAREMLTRLSAMLPVNVRGMWIGTFHGLCNRFLRAHHREAGLPQLFQILDTQDQQAAIKRLMKSLNVNDEKYPPRQVQYFINGNKEKGIRASHAEAYDEYSRKMVELYAAYDEQCQREGVVDFSELLLRTYEVLNRNEVLRQHYQSRFGFILVDEFQDTNRLQYLWIKLLAGHQGAVFAVGDDDQSIYAFRGADTGNMREFERDFGVRNIVRLEQNYRSHANILDAANALIKNNPSRLGKNLWTDAGAGEPIRVFEAPSDGGEAQFIVEEAQSLSREGIALTDVALLYRSNAQSRVFEHALFQAGISYRVYGGLRFFERQEIKHALAYLRLAANADDDGAFMRVVNFPTRGIGARSIEQLQDAATARGISLFHAAKETALSGRSGANLTAFVTMIELLSASANDLTLPELIEEMLERSGLRTHYQNEREGADRLENLNELLSAAAGFEPEQVDGEETDSLAGFLAHASLEAGEHEAGEGKDAIQLMTVHAAKGLEFNVVFVSGLEEGLFPHDQSKNEADGIEEERRLMYVAVTRARQRLYLSYAQTRMLHGQMRYGVVSRFVGEIPEGLCKWLTPPQPSLSFGGFAPRRDLWGDVRGRGNGSAQLRPVREPSPNFGGLPFQIGQNVRHAKFGEGVVLSCEGRGSDGRVQIKFRSDGVKWLALEFAKLQAV